MTGAGVAAGGEGVTEAGVAAGVDGVTGAGVAAQGSLGADIRKPKKRTRARMVKEGTDVLYVGKLAKQTRDTEEEEERENKDP